MNLRDVLKIYYAPQYRKELMQIMQHHCLYESFQHHIKAYRKGLRQNDISQHLTVYNHLLSVIMNTVIEWHRGLSHENAYNSDAALLVHLSATLAHHPMACQPGSKELYDHELETFIAQNSEDVHWNTFGLLLAKANQMMSAGYGIRAQHQLPLFQGRKPMTWFTYISRKGDKEHKRNFQAFLELLAIIFPGIRTPARMSRLFEKCCISYTIIVPEEDLRAVLEVFRMLHEDGRIKCHYTRGVFKHLQVHFKPPEGEAYPENKDFYRLNITSLKNKDEQQMILDRIRPFRERFCQSTVS